MIHFYTRLTICVLTTCFFLAVSGDRAAHARAPSLFFTPEQSVQIDKELRKHPPNDNAQNRNILHLGSILYVNDREWSVWLQGREWTPKTDDPDIRIIAVRPDEVRIEIRQGNGESALSARLHPNQSINMLTGTVEEGF